jgi:hypothetical protein
LKKVLRGAGSNWTGKATRARNYGSKVEVAGGKGQQPAPGPDDDGERLLRQKLEVSNLEVPANSMGGRQKSSDPRQHRL